MRQGGLTLLLTLLTSAGCGGTERTGSGEPAPAPRKDAAVAPLDAGVQAPDAQAPADASQIADAITDDDAGVSPDATQLDGTVPDATQVDVGFPDSGVGNPDAQPAPDAMVPPDSGPADPGPAVLNPGWIGGPCTRDADCAFAGGRCLTAADGYPGGSCVQSCTRLCPDRAQPLDSVTFCIDGGGTDGQCVSRCDYTLSPTGCRRGYACLPEKRKNQPSVVRHSCVPRTGVPNRPTPPFDIGAACVNASDCERNTCLDGLPGGYCSQEACDVVGCPSGSRCFRIGLEDFHACLKSCAGNSDCRTAESYGCDADQTCWYQPPPRPTCNTAGGAAACGRHASIASRDFVVVTKGQRRLTLCNGTSEVRSYCVGLGSSPVLDKEREGDRRTPEGVFYIPRVLPNSQYYKAFLLSYPDNADAARGLAQGLITQSEHDAIVSAQAGGREPPQFTNLGGLIEIHGRGSSSDWTWGCIAVEDSTIDDLWGVLGVGDTIVVEH